MRFMMIVKPPAYHDTQIDKAELAAMGRYNEELKRANVLVDMNGLAPTEDGAKIKFAGSRRTVIQGPFSEATEVIGGYWIIDVASKAEALDWAKRIPFGTEVHPGHEVEVELRRVMEPSDFA
ncbi:MAG TPA: YciI family protein [Kofleriaceae bacterium]|jgi:hypothetical protein